MNYPTPIAHRTVAVSAAASALLSAVVALAAIWGGAPLAAIPWVISMIVGASILLYPYIDRRSAATTVPVTGVNERSQLDEQPRARNLSTFGGRR